MLNSLFKRRRKFVFMDYASGTPVDKKVFKKMKPFFTKNFFNASAIYNEGFMIRETLNRERENIARYISARPKEIVFTDGGTEANNLIIRGLVSRWKRENKGKKAHIITSKIEHSSILETCSLLERDGLIEVSYVSVDENGFLDLVEFKKSFRENTILVSVGYVNGEIGVVQDIRGIAKIIRHHKKKNNINTPYFHTDAIQANYFDVNVQKLGVDFITINGSKIYGPKKIAFLYKKSDIVVDPIITGGGQEFKLRAGTENIPSIIGLSESIKLINKKKNSEKKRLLKLRDFMEALLKKKMNISFIINGEDVERTPNIVNISIQDISSEELVLRLDAFGIKVSIKSACKSGESGDSHVILSLRDDNTQSIRFSFGKNTSKKDIKYVVNKLVKIVDNMQVTMDKYK